VLLLNVVRPEPAGSEPDVPAPRGSAEGVLRASLDASFAEGVSPEISFVVSARPMDEIRRVARARRCESVLLGLRDLSDRGDAEAFDRLVDGVESDVIVLRAQPAWSIAQARRVLVAVGGRSRHSPLRARLLGSLRRLGRPEVTYLSVLPPAAGDEAVSRLLRRLSASADDEMGGFAEVAVERHADPAARIAERAADADLLILGLYQEAGRHLRLSPLILRIAREAPCALVVLGYKARH
jgi:hypothetical protein